MIDLERVMLKLAPQGGWQIRENKVVYDDGEKPVSQALINAELTKIKATKYQDLRAREYPNIGDQLDALWKGGAELEAMQAKIKAVKAKYPKV